MIHSIKIDDDIDERLKEFNAKLPDDQEIVDLVTASNYLFVTTAKKEVKQPFAPMGLLHDHFKRGHNKT